MTENKNVLRVLKGFLSLSETEKRELQLEINSFNASDSLTKATRKIQIELKADLGPTNNNKSCVCCGRG